MKQFTLGAAFATFVYAAVSVLLGASQPQAPPSPVVRLPVIVTEVYDGDTVKVLPALEIRVRLLDCWAPELRDAGGPEAKAHLKQLVEKNGQLLIEVPIYDSLSKSISFGRLLGRIYRDDVDLGAQMVKDGFATEERQ